MGRGEREKERERERERGTKERSHIHNAGGGKVKNRYEGERESPRDRDRKEETDSQKVFEKCLCSHDMSRNLAGSEQTYMVAFIRIISAVHGKRKKVTRRSERRVVVSNH